MFRTRIRVHSIQRPAATGLTTLRLTSTSTNATGVPIGAEDPRYLHHFLQTHKAPQESVNYFSKLTWTKSIFEASESTYKLVPFYSRHLQERTGESRFFAQTVNTPTTVPHVLAFCRRNLNTPEHEGVTTQTADEQALASPDLMCLVRLGRDLESHPGIVNGGFQGVIFDEVMYCLILLHQDNITTAASKNGSLSPTGPRTKHYTLSITTEFCAPVKAPSDVLVRASLVSRQGRKWFTRAEIVDCDGRVLTRGESWWLTARTALS